MTGKGPRILEALRQAAEGDYGAVHTQGETWVKKAKQGGACYLVWSNEHRSWWRPHSCGYTGVISAAGRYTYDEAKRICENANFALFQGREPNEVMVLAPECLLISLADEAAE